MRATSFSATLVGTLICELNQLLYVDVSKNRSTINAVLFAAVVSIASPLVSCVRAAAEEVTDTTLSLFQYDASQPLDIRESRTETQGNVTIHDITYASPKGGRVTAYLITPAGKGPFPGIVYQHWGLGNRVWVDAA